MALKAWQQSQHNASGQQSLRIVALTPQQSLTLQYSPAQQAYQVQASPSDAGKPWEQVLAEHSEALLGTQQLLQALEQATQRPIQVLGKPLGLPAEDKTPARHSSQPQSYQHTSATSPTVGRPSASGAMPQSPELPLPPRGQRVEQSPQGEMSRSWLDRALFPEAQAPVAAPTNQGFTPQQLADFRILAGQLKQQETLHRQNPSKGLDSVDALQVLIGHAANVTNNNPETFLRLMNEAVLGTVADIPNVPKSQSTRIDFGDLGMHEIYQDQSTMQMYHFWGYVNVGYYLPKDVAKVFNYGHEVLEPLAAKFLDKNPKIKKHIPSSNRLSRTGSKEDYRLSGVGYNLGQALAKGHITPKQLAKIIDRMLRTDDYRPFPDDKIPEELE